MTVQQWSTTASSNNAAPPTGAPEGQTPGSVNNVMREMMASTAIESQVNRVKVLNSVAGTNTITGSMTPALTAYSAGMIVIFTPAANNTTAATININSLGALDILKEDGDALLADDLVAGIPAQLVLDSGADDFVLMNPQNRTSAIVTPNLSAAEMGYKGLPQNIQNGNYTFVLADAGKHVYKASGAGNTLTIPANASVAFPIGTVLTVYNGSAQAVTIAITSDVMGLCGTSSTGSRTLTGDNGVAVATKVTSTVWLISGTGLT